MDPEPSTTTMSEAGSAAGTAGAPDTPKKAAVTATPKQRFNLCIGRTRRSDAGRTVAIVSSANLI
jgi:hypothetical protein